MITRVQKSILASRNIPSPASGEGEGEGKISSTLTSFLSLQRRARKGYAVSKVPSSLRHQC
jgi:hypothetical protein